MTVPKIMGPQALRRQRGRVRRRQESAARLHKAMGLERDAGRDTALLRRIEDEDVAAERLLMPAANRFDWLEP